MALRIAAILVATLVLAGCTDADWDQAASFAGLDDAAVAQDSAPAPAPGPARLTPARPVVTAATGDDPFCHAVAARDSEAGAFDPPTQSRVFAQSYSQCLAIFGPGR